MVAKINVGNSLFGALAYNGQKVNEGEGKLLASNKVFDNGTGKVDMARAMADFERYLPARMRTENPVIHISLNPHPGDKLTDTELTDIAREYMQQLGYGEQPYIIFKHEDIERSHVHIVSVRVGLDGKRLNNDYIHRRSKRITTALEKKYGLHPSGERRERLAPGALRKVEASDGNVKRQIGNVLRNLSPSYRFQSLGEYRALLSIYNVSVEEARGEVHGREYHGLVYSATDNAGNKTGNPIKASLFGKYAGYETFEKRCATSKQEIKEKELGKETKAKVLAALRQTSTRADFVKILQAKGIDTVLRETDEGRIYGATFIDHNTQCVLNGSRMGKELSANALQEHFGFPPVHIPLPDITHEPAPSAEDTPVFRQDEFADSGLGELPIEAHGTDYEEEAFRRRMQRKKRKGRRI